MNRLHFKWKLVIAAVALVGFWETSFANVLHAETPSVMSQQVDGLVLAVHADIAGKKLPGQPSTQKTSAPVAASVIKQQALINVPAQSQLPDLYNGCEITSLSMLMTAENHPVDKLTLADDIVKDQTPETFNSDGSIAGWGDPNDGFVGDISGQNTGYGVYHGPIASLLNSLMPGQALDLTGHSFTRIESQLSAGIPVVVWTTVNFAPTDSFVTWQSPNGPVRATFNEHCVLLVGYNQNQVFINDPLDGTQAKAVDKISFLAAWQQLGQQAVSVQE